MRGGEEDPRVIGDQRLLDADVRYMGSEDRPDGRRLAESGEVCSPKRPFPDEPSILDPPARDTTRRLFVRLRQRQGDPTYVVPGGHDHRSSPITRAGSPAVQGGEECPVRRIVGPGRETGRVSRFRLCLLYTSDAADEEDSVDLGGRRIS